VISRSLVVILGVAFHGLVFACDLTGSRLGGDVTVDQDRLSEARARTTVSGAYLVAWDMVSRYLEERGSRVDLKDYLITFDEDEDYYIIYFVKPRLGPVVGGGGAKALVKKDTLEVLDFQFAR